MKSPRRRTIGVLASEAGVDVETIRYYERRGLLTQPPRRQGGREYGSEALWRLRYIKVAQGWGWKLRDIQGLLESAEASPNFCASVRAAAMRRIEEIDRLAAQLQVQRTQLTEFISACAAKPDSQRCPVFKRLSQTG